MAEFLPQVGSTQTLMSVATRWSKRIAVAAVAFFAGALGGGVLVAWVDESAPGWILVLAVCAVFVPMSGVIGFWFAESAWLSAIGILSGVFVGVCATLLIFFPDAANLFPYAAAVWTGLALVPVSGGALVGVLVRLKKRRRERVG